MQHLFLQKADSRDKVHETLLVYHGAKGLPSASYNLGPWTLWAHFVSPTIPSPLAHIAVPVGTTPVPTKPPLLASLVFVQLDGDPDAQQNRHNHNPQTFYDHWPCID